MLTGRFGATSGRPYIEGKLYVPSLDLQAPVSFLVDTGADSTTLMPADAARLGLDLSSLPDSQTLCIGIGGVAQCHVVDGLLVFSDDSQLYSYVLRLTVAPPAQGLDDLPSLLGRDVLDNWAMTYDPQRSRLTFVVRRADHKIEIGG